MDSIEIISNSYHIGDIITNAGIVSSSSRQGEAFPYREGLRKRMLQNKTWSPWQTHMVNFATPANVSHN